MQPLTITGMPLGGPDMTLLERIGDVSYYELHIVVKNELGRTAIAGLARDWPILRRDAAIADLQARLAAAERHAAELEQQLLVQSESVIPLAVARAATGAEPPAWERYANPNAQRKCPYCKVRPKVRGLAAHIAAAHPGQPIPASVPPAPATLPARPTAVAADAPFVCQQCQADGRPTTHTASVKLPHLCIKCAAAVLPAAA